MAHRRNKRSVLVASAALAIGASLAMLAVMVQAAEKKMGPAIGPEKKVIFFGCNSIDPQYLRAHLAELEKLPVDGTIIPVYPDDHGPRRSGQEERWFGPRVFKIEDFSEALADLKAVKSLRLTDNFVYFGTSVRFPPGDAVVRDWFDADWHEVAQNGAVAATIARESGFKGLCIDIEHYAQGTGLWQRLFDYGHYVNQAKAAGVEPRTFDECAAQVTRRGKELVAAISAAYPDITLLIIPFTGTRRMLHYRLALPFVDGMLQGVGPQATLIDGGEHGYPLETHAQFAELRRTAEHGGARNSSVPGLYAKIQYAFGVWIDMDARGTGYKDRSVPGWRTNPGELDKNFRTPANVEHSIYNALVAADKYVWLYVWHPHVWWDPNVTLDGQARQCGSCPHKGVPDAYWQAIANARLPHDPAWVPDHPDTPRVITAGELAGRGRNILPNGDFETWTLGPNKPPDHWVLGGRQPVIRKARANAKVGTSAVQLGISGTEGHRFLDYHIPLGDMAGKTITFGAWTRTSSANAFLSIMDWVGNDHKPDHSPQCPSDGKWHFLTATRKIRADATGEIWFRMNGSFFSADENIFFDGAMAVVEK